jgi:hypothetical protein
MEFSKNKILEIGKSFDNGLISFETLTDSEKYALSKYYALKNETLDNNINATTSSLCQLDATLDNVYSSLTKIK